MIGFHRQGIIRLIFVKATIFSSQYKRKLKNPPFFPYTTAVFESLLRGLKTERKIFPASILTLLTSSLT